MISIQYSSQQGTAPTWPWALVGGLRILKVESGRLHQHSSPSQSTGDRRGGGIGRATQRKMRDRCSNFRWKGFCVAWKNKAKSENKNSWLAFRQTFPYVIYTVSIHTCVSTIRYQGKDKPNETTGKLCRMLLPGWFCLGMRSVVSWSSLGPQTPGHLSPLWNRQSVEQEREGGEGGGRHFNGTLST